MFASSYGRVRGFVLFIRSLLVLVSFGASGAFAQDMGNALATNQTLVVNQYLSSTNKQYKLVMQGDGNLALYRMPSTYLWGTGATTGRRAVMQGDGNLCLTYLTGGGVWCNYSNGAGGDYYLIVRDTGDVEIYRGTPNNPGGSVLVWTTLLDAAYYNGRYADLKNAFNGDARRLMDHWINSGRYEGRSPRNGISDQGRINAISVNLDTNFYTNKYPDLRNAFGFNADGLYQHWMTFGRKEGRVPNKATEELLAPPARSAHMRDIMRTGDWLREGERMVSADGRFRLDLQPDGQFIIYEGTPAANTRRWWQNSQGFPQGPQNPYFVSMQPDGHLCEYKGTGPSDNRGFIGCTPAGAGGPVGRYFAALQNDGNLAIYKGGGPADNRGWIWDRITTKPSSGFNFSAAVESVGTFIVNTVNTIAAGTTAAANATGAGTVYAANEFAREAAIAANAIADAFKGKLDYTLDFDVLTVGDAGVTLKLRGKLDHQYPSQIGGTGQISVQQTEAPAPGQAVNSGSSTWKITGSRAGTVVLRISNPVNSIDINMTVRPK